METSKANISLSKLVPNCSLLKLRRISHQINVIKLNYYQIILHLEEVNRDRLAQRRETYANRRKLFRLWKRTKTCVLRAEL